MIPTVERTRPLDFRCPQCQANEGVGCIQTWDGVSYPAGIFHADRIRTAEKMSFEDRAAWQEWQKMVAHVGRRVTR